VEHAAARGAGGGYTSSIVGAFDANALFRGHFLTSINRTDTFVLGKELVGENRGIDRILRRLKLHAEGRQFGGQNS
jgi:hypothetical protein